MALWDKPLWQAALFVLACSRLPESAAPTGGLVDPSNVDLSNSIRYRALTRADFQGASVPEAFAKVADRVGAATCGNVLTTPDTQLQIVREQSENGESLFRVSVKKLRFYALMDRNCSWWNDKQSAVPPDYVLEHEQIHFALYELGARQLNASVGRIADDVQTEGSTLDEVRQHADEILRRAVMGALEVILERNRAFDEDTSLGYKPDRQKAWLLRVEQELASTQLLARSAEPFELDQPRAQRLPW